MKTEEQERLSKLTESVVDELDDMNAEQRWQRVWSLVTEAYMAGRAEDQTTEDLAIMASLLCETTKRLFNRRQDIDILRGWVDIMSALDRQVDKVLDLPSTSYISEMTLEKFNARMDTLFDKYGERMSVLQKKHRSRSLEELETEGYVGPSGLIRALGELMGELGQIMEQDDNEG